MILAEFERVLLARALNHPNVRHSHIVGSQYTCNPPPDTNTDLDYLVLVKRGAWGAYAEFLEKVLGFVDDGSRGPWMSDQFLSYKKDSVNLIITQNENMYSRFMLATNLAKRFNLLDKQDRVDLFEAIGTKGDCTEGLKF